MTLYIIGLILIIPKIVQALMETISNKKFPISLSIFLTSLLTFGSMLCIWNLAMCDVPVWELFILIGAMAFLVFSIIRIEREELKEHINKNKEK